MERKYGKSLGNISLGPKPPCSCAALCLLHPDPVNTVLRWVRSRGQGPWPRVNLRTGLSHSRNHLGRQGPVQEISSFQFLTLEPLHPCFQDANHKLCITHVHVCYHFAKFFLKGSSCIFWGLRSQLSILVVRQCESVKLR